MAAARLRIHYCWLVVVTSAVWFVVDIVLFLYFTDCLLPSDRCTQHQQQASTASVTGSPPQRSFFGRLLPGSLYRCLCFVVWLALGSVCAVIRLAKQHCRNSFGWWSLLNRCVCTANSSMLCISHIVSGSLPWYSIDSTVLLWWELCKYSLRVSSKWIFGSW